MVLESAREVEARGEDPLATSQPRVRVRARAARPPRARAASALRCQHAPCASTSPAISTDPYRRYLQVNVAFKIISIKTLWTRCPSIIIYSTEQTLSDIMRQHT